MERYSGGSEQTDHPYSNNRSEYGESDLKFSVDNEELSSKVALVEKSTSTKASNTALSGILMSIAGSNLTFSATDGDRSLRVPVHLRSAPEGEGRVLVPGRLLEGVVRLLGDGVSSIEYRSTEKDISISSGSSKFHLKTMFADDFPPLPEVGGDWTSIPSMTFNRSLDLVSQSVVTSDIRPIYKGINLTLSEGQMVMMSTDSYRFAVKRSPLSTEIVESVKTIPPGALKDVSRAISLTGAEMIKYSAGERGVLFDVDGVILTSTTIEGTFITDKDVIPETWNFDVRLPRQEFLEAVRRVGTMVKSPSPVRLLFSSGEVVISAFNAELGDAEEALPVMWDDEDLLVGINPEYLVHGLGLIGAEEVLLRLISKQRPALLEAVDDSSFRYLIMTQRLAE